MLLHSFLIELNKIKAKAKSVRRTDVIKSNCLFVVLFVKFNSIQAKSESRNNSKICLHPVRKDDRLNRSNERYDNKKNENGGIWTRIDERTDE